MYGLDSADRVVSIAEGPKRPSVFRLTGWGPRDILLTAGGRGALPSHKPAQPAEQAITVKLHAADSPENGPWEAEESALDEQGSCAPSQ